MKSRIELVMVCCMFVGRHYTYTRDDVYGGLKIERYLNINSWKII